MRTILWKKYCWSSLPNCHECTFRERKKLKIQFEAEAEKAREEDTEYVMPHDRDIGSDLEYPMKLDPSTKHFICKRCGLYATREQIFDIRDKLNQRESTKEDKQYDYLEWWQKSKKDK